MNAILENLTGMDALTDEVIAADCLFSAKAGVRLSAQALTETATPELRALMRRQLQAALELHENITKAMMEKGWYHPYNMDEQIDVDTRRANNALDVAD